MVPSDGSGEVIILKDHEPFQVQLYVITLSEILMHPVDKVKLIYHNLIYDSMKF